MRTTRSYSQDDYAQECKAYMEIKHFMSNRISEQEKEIQYLKDLVLYHSTKHLQMYEWLSDINATLQKLDSPKKSPKVNTNDNNNHSLNISAEFIDSLSFSE